MKDLDVFMKLCIDSLEYEKISKQAENAFPHEVVGIMAGDREKNHVLECKILINERAETQNRYKVSPIALMRAEQEIESRGLEIVGYYHSHPNHTSQGGLIPCARALFILPDLEFHHSYP